VKLQRLKLAELASIAEIVSAIAVIASLIYVAVQIDQNTLAIKHSTNQERLNFGRDQAELVITEPGLAELVLRAEQNVDDLNEVDRLKFYEWATWRLSVWEQTYQANLDGLMEEESWVAWDGYFLLIVEGKPGYVQFFNNTPQIWDARFYKHVDAVLGLKPIAGHTLH